MLYAHWSAHDSISSTLPNDIAANEIEHEGGKKGKSGSKAALQILPFYHSSHQMLIAQTDSGAFDGSRLKVVFSFSDGAESV